MKNKFFIIGTIIFLWLNFSVRAVSQSTKAEYQIIPIPNKITYHKQKPFIFNKNTVIRYPKQNKELASDARFLALYINQLTGYHVQVKAGKQRPGDIYLNVEKNESTPEAYKLQIDSSSIQIIGHSGAGVFYGIQTLRKSLPIIKNTENRDQSSIQFPAASITDSPRFSYRGMMLDVSRHFFSPDEIKRYIDILALHNINYLHWHLTDDQGWRIEIKKYPLLTKIGSIREQTVIGHNTGHYDGKIYKGYYTQKEIKDIVAYAAKQHITIVPEIDLPGHLQAALAAYPQLGCTGGPYKVWTQWGISDDVICAGNENAIHFLEDVLNEVIQLFPSPYIHIGGDECPKKRWKNCPKCQERIRQLGIRGDKKHSAEDYLQSYVMTKIEHYVENRGKHIIGWDEIFEGKPAPNATIMSWRGMSGGISAARQHHNVIMTPNSHVYFDYYQTTDTEHEPMAIGGYIPVERVYSLEPTEGIPNAEKHYVIGVQANLWTEYIPNFKQVEYMILPRISALSEIQWSLPQQKNYKYFQQRILHMIDIYDQLKLNYATHMLDISAQYNPDTISNSLNISLNILGKGKIYYTLDGSEPDSNSQIYHPTKPINIRHDATLKAIALRPNGKHSRIYTQKITFSKSAMKPIKLKYQPNPEYAYQGASVLTDGLYGSTNYKTGRWLGFQGRDVEAIIDLQHTERISSIAFNTNVVKGDWIMRPKAICISLSNDGKNFHEVLSQTIPELTPSDKDGIYPQTFHFNSEESRYVKVILKNGTLPSWHSGAGYPAFIFIDEINIQ